ncbi:MAG: secretin N-terminal domain-containing protein [Planctomycetota bacterium]
MRIRRLVRGRARLAGLLLCAAALAGPARPAHAQEQPEVKTADGRKTVTISTRSMPLAEFLELISVSCKLNLVCPKGISGDVSANFHDVPALDVLDAVLEANGYEYVVETAAGQSIIKIRKAVAAAEAAGAPGEPPAAPAVQVHPDGTASVSAQALPLAEFIDLLSGRCKLNVVCPRDISGKVSATLNRVPPREILRTVLEANGYQAVAEEVAGLEILKVRPLAPPAEAEEEAPDEEPLVVQTFLLSYTTADDINEVARTLLTKSGSVADVPGKNAIVVRDTAAALKEVEAVVTAFDRAPRQVMIDAKVVEIGKTDLEERGFNWSMFQDMNIADLTLEASYARDATWTTVKQSGSPDSRTRDITRTTGTNVDLRGGILEENNAQLLLDFFDTLTNTKIISRPSVRTIDNKAAHIISGQIVPIPLFDFAKDTGVRTLSGFQEEQIGVELTVTPHINEDGYITLEVNPKVESIDRYITVDGNEQRPVKNTRQARTTIRIQDGQTAVIGGLTSSDTKVTRTGLPFFKDLPGLGWLFSHKTNDVEHSELIIFITPKTIGQGPEKLTEKQKGLLREIEEVGIVPAVGPDLPPGDEDE